ncbi:hypothetical protein JB92DRAFT_3112076 [Gautieria morchelliformis]|nr:hypothetical protein JB92DRAFT_3112076 [Gautieria morchelliformis]
MLAMGAISNKTYRIGVDVGGTNTDSVLLCADPEDASQPNRGVLASYKHPTTPNISLGIEAAVGAVLRESLIPPDKIASLMIGTTHFMNAVVEADSRRLSKVAVIRLGAPYTAECPPFLDFPLSLRSVMEGHVAIVKGGLQIDGSLINEIDEKELVHESIEIQQKGLKAVTIIGIYSPLDKNDGSSQEERARGIMSKVLGPSVDIVCSREVGPAGLLERENASILNASILAFARRTISGFQRAMRRLGLTCPLFLTQNDGTLTSSEAAARLPIRTFSSGATNSMRGASFLAGVGVTDTSMVKNSGGSNIIVVDVGGTTTDVGVLLPSGFPRQAAAFIKVGGVRTNFSMPDVFSIGLGGGSRVRVKNVEGDQSPTVTVGPDSTGYQLLTDGLVFGGSTLTATDVVVAGDPSLPIGDPGKVTNGAIEQGVIEGAKVTIKKLLEDVIDRMKTSPEPATVLLVGGGCVIAPSELSGVGELIRPPFFSCANAVGACVANVAGDVGEFEFSVPAGTSYEILRWLLDTIEILKDLDLSTVLERCKTEAMERAVRAGAKPDTVRVVEVDNLPVQYVTNKATRLIVKAVGELDPASMIGSSTLDIPGEYSDEDESTKAEPKRDPIGRIDVEDYRPYINANEEWMLSELDLEWIADGCGILGTGGGGSPYPSYIMARQILRDGGNIRVISHDSLPDDATILRGFFMGSPSVSNERLQAGNETATACRNLSRFMHLGAPAAVISDEIGGGNGIQPMILASAKHLNVPVFDGDLMGRAYPNMWQSLPAAYGVPDSLTPCAISDGVGNSVVLPSTSSQRMVETILRGVCTDLGSKAGVSMAPLSAGICRKYGVTKTVSQAWRIGRAVALQRQIKSVNDVQVALGQRLRLVFIPSDIQGIPGAILKLQNGKILFRGKIINVRREVRAGFTWGSVTMAPLLPDEAEQASDVAQAPDPQSRLLISFQNENLTAELLADDPAPKQMLAVVPDLITVLDAQSGSSLGTHEYRYGLRVFVLALAGRLCGRRIKDSKMADRKPLGEGSPTLDLHPRRLRSFIRLDVPYHPVGTYVEPTSVIEEYTQRGTRTG